MNNKFQPFAPANSTSHSTSHSPLLILPAIQPATTAVVRVPRTTHSPLLMPIRYLSHDLSTDLLSKFYLYPDLNLLSVPTTRTSTCITAVYSCYSTGAPITDAATSQGAPAGHRLLAACSPACCPSPPAPKEDAQRWHGHQSGCSRWWPAAAGAPISAPLVGVLPLVVGCTDGVFFLRDVAAALPRRRMQQCEGGGGGRVWEGGKKEVGAEWRVQVAKSPASSQTRRMRCRAAAAAAVSAIGASEYPLPSHVRFPPGRSPPWSLPLMVRSLPRGLLSPRSPRWRFRPSVVAVAAILSRSSE